MGRPSAIRPLESRIGGWLANQVRARIDLNAHDFDAHESEAFSCGRPALDPHGQGVSRVTEGPTNGVAVVTDGTTTILVAEFPDPDSATQAYDVLCVSQNDTFIIDAAIVVERGDDGKLHAVATTDHSTRDGIGWGAVAGAVVGVLFPPSILAGVVVGGLAGGVIGKLRNLHHNHEIEDDLDTSIGVGHSAVVVIAEDPDQVAADEAFAHAVRVTQKQLSKQAVRDIKSAVVEGDSAE